MKKTILQEPAPAAVTQARARNLRSIGVAKACRPEACQPSVTPGSPGTRWVERWLPLALAVVLMTGARGSIRAAERAAVSKSSAPAAMDDFTGMDLAELMQVKVPLVYGASKHEQKITEAPSAVSIVTADDIKMYGHRTLRDVLNSVRGFYVSYDRIYSFVGVRGVNRPGDWGGRVLIMLDGHRLNDPVYDSALSGTEGFLDVDLIDRVEVIRGPGSSLYGNNAFFSVINIITRRGQASSWGEVSSSVASYETYIGRFTLGHQFTNGVEFIASGTVRDSAGHKRLYFNELRSINNGIAENLDHDQGTHFMASARYGDFTLSGGYNDREKENPVAAYGVVFNQGRPFVYDQRAFAELKYTHEFGNDWNVLGRVFYDHYHFDADYYYDYVGAGNPADVVLNRDISLAQSWGGEAQVSKVLLDKHRLTVGGEFRDDLHLDLKNFDVVSGDTYLDTRNDADNFGLYGQGEFVLVTPLTLNAGLRYDRLTAFGDTVNPRTALIYNPWRETAFKAVYGQAFRAPNAYEFGYLSASYDANPDLRPENIRAYELVWEQGFARYYHFTTTMFYNDIHDLITRQINPVNGHFVSRNTDSVTAWGTELELEAQWPRGWRSRTSYTYAHATDGLTGTRLSNSPEHLGKVGLIMPLYRDKLFAGIEVLVMSDRLTAREQTVGASAQVNLTLFSRELVKGLEASFSVYNLFDDEYSSPVSLDFKQNAIPQDGRTFRGKLTWRF